MRPDRFSLTRWFEWACLMALALVCVQSARKADSVTDPTAILAKKLSLPSRALAPIEAAISPSRPLSAVASERASFREYKMRVIEARRVRRQILEGDKGDALVSGGLSYARLKGWAAVPQERLSWFESNGVMGRRAGYALVRGRRDAGALQIQSDGERPVLFDPASGRIGVVSGLYAVTPKRFDDVAAIARSHGLASERSFESINVVFFKARAGENMADRLQKLQKDFRVKKAELDIIKNDLVTD